jgi:hypothetical protein
VRGNEKVKVIDNAEEVKIFVKFLHDINQYLKTIYNSDGYYNYENGIIICNGKRQVTPYVTVEPQYNKKNDFLKDIINGSSFTIVGNEYFQFHKNYKNNINRIEITERTIGFYTDLPLVELIFPKLKLETKKFDATRFELLGSFKLSEDSVKEIIDSGNNPFNIYMDFDSGTGLINVEPDGSFLQLIFNKKFIVGLKSTKTFTSGILSNVYDFDSENNLYLVELIIMSKEITTKQFMVVTDVLIGDDE